MISNKHSSPISRRDFLKLAGAGLGSLVLSPLSRVLPLAQFPQSERLGRVLVRSDLRAQPHEMGNVIKTVYEDTVLEWLREVNGITGIAGASYNKRWVETPEGYIFASYIQPVRNLPNSPLATLPEGKSGFWSEVTVPYVDLALDNPPPRSHWFKDILSYNLTPRLYYSQVVWIDQVRAGDAGQVLYRVNEDPGHGYGYGDIFWADASAFRPLTEEDTAPIDPDVDPNTKTIAINLTYQTLSCFEGASEVYFCRISGGTKYDAYGNLVDKWSTPMGDQSTWRKMFSIHMSGGTTGAGFDTPAVSWTTFFNGEGVAIHAAFWHNDFGTPRSHGCVNCQPEDAKWIFRWTTPYVSLEQSEVQLTWPDHGTIVSVTERTF